MKNCNKKNHPDHSKELARVKRITGQINGIGKMIEEKRYCVDILQQLNAIKSAVSGLQANILETHLQSCVREVFESGKKKQVDKKIEELKNVFTKYSS